MTMGEVVRYFGLDTVKRGDKTIILNDSEFRYVWKGLKVEERPALQNDKNGSWKVGHTTYREV